MKEFLNKVDNIVFKLQSEDEEISENLKITIVLRALPQEYDSFIAAIQFQQISYLQLKERMIERSLGELKQARYEFYVHCGSSDS